MTASKNLKRLIRARVRQTGERYTAARQFFLNHEESKTMSNSGLNGWYVAGTARNAYDAGRDATVVRDGRHCGYIRSNRETIEGVGTLEGFGTVMQDVKPDLYLGKRIRLSGSLRAQDVSEWAGLWLRVDDPNTQTLDNMRDRAVKGSTDWEQFTAVLDVPTDAKNIALGVHLTGTGCVWIDSLSFEVVDKNVPLTKAPSTDPRSPQPVNLSFEVSGGD
ncbi:MAG: hypothetical protein AAF525_07900 [Pseudomonadota bacterium]